MFTTTIVIAGILCRHRDSESLPAFIILSWLLWEAYHVPPDQFPRMLYLEPCITTQIKDCSQTSYNGNIHQTTIVNVKTITGCLMSWDGWTIPGVCVKEVRMQPLVATQEAGSQDIREPTTLSTACLSDNLQKTINVHILQTNTGTATLLVNR